MSIMSKGKLYTVDDKGIVNQSPIAPSFTGMFSDVSGFPDFSARRLRQGKTPSGNSYQRRKQRRLSKRVFEGQKALSKLASIAMVAIAVSRKSSGSFFPFI